MDRCRNRGYRGGKGWIMSFPVIDLTGSPLEQGRAHGSQLRDRVFTNIKVYYERLQREAMLGRQETRRRAQLYFDAITQQSPDYADAMRGVAEGAGCELVDIAMLNVRYELLYYQFGVGGANAGGATAPEPDGCTAFALLPSETANGHLWIGQNWDWIPEVMGAVLRTTDADGTRVLAFTEAGIVGGKIGVSSNGIGLCVNGMTTSKDDWSSLRKPFHVRCYEILRARSFEAALNVVTSEPRACTTNFLIGATPADVVDLETAPEICNQLRCADNGTLVHTNNFLDPSAVGVEEAPNPRRPYSVGRCDRMGDLLRGATRPVSIAMVESMLQDHLRWPYGICRHRGPDEPPEKHYVTVTSVIIDLDARVIRLTDGPPCTSERQTVTL
jgi:isopenicillin-N N-acyltransferase like protein